MKDYIRERIAHFRLSRSLDYLAEYTDTTQNFGNIIPYHFSHAVSDVQSEFRADTLSNIKKHLENIASRINSTFDFEKARDLIIARAISVTMREPALKYARYSVLMGFLYWFLHLDDLTRTDMISAGQPRKLDLKTRLIYEENYKAHLDRAFNAYAGLVLIGSGLGSGLNAWGGLRISREAVIV